MRRIILNMAMSLDGYISDETGGFDWIQGQGDKRADTESKFDFENFLEGIDTIVMGSYAYEDCIMTGIAKFEGRKIIVATSREFDAVDGVEFCEGNIVEKIITLKSEAGKDIWIFGGALLADTFIKASAIDKYILGVVPVILGRGRRIFRGNMPETELRLEEIVVDDGITILSYSRK